MAAKPLSYYVRTDRYAFDTYSESFLISIGDANRYAHAAFPRMPAGESIIDIICNLRLERLAAQGTDLLFRAADIAEHVWPVLEAEYGDTTSYDVLRTIIGQHYDSDYIMPDVEKWIAARESQGLG